MKRTAGILLSGFIGLASAVNIAGQPKLTAKDYDDFYTNVILEAKNGNKAEWLASYDSVVNFVAQGPAGRRSASRRQPARPREGCARQRLLEGPGAARP